MKIAKARRQEVTPMTVATFMNVSSDTCAMAQVCQAREGEGGVGGRGMGRAGGEEDWGQGKGEGARRRTGVDAAEN